MNYEIYIGTLNAYPPVTKNTAEALCPSSTEHYAAKRYYESVLVFIFHVFCQKHVSICYDAEKEIEKLGTLAKVSTLVKLNWKY